MRHLARVLAVLAAAGACEGDDGGGRPMLPPACESPVQGSAITFRFVAQTQGAALLVTSPPGDLRRFVVEQQGRIKLLDDAGSLSAPFLDISRDAQFACCGEQGLLGLAFHPDYATNRTFFVFYTTTNANVVARYQASATDPNVADPASKVVILSIDDFASNHNGGMIEFGPDGLLYIGTGDGGGGGDPMDYGQDPNALLGKMLRIDVDKREDGKEYGIPPGNPFATTGGGAPEILIMGLRNPWRWSFDRATGDLYIGDVGQNLIEELTAIPAGMFAGANLGWNMYEGTRCFQQPCNPANKSMPQYERSHGDNWCSVITGEVYRGSCYPDLVGKHFLTDYCSAELVAVELAGSNLTSELPRTSFVDHAGQTRSGLPAAPTSLHGDARGELYLTTESCCGNQAGGGIFRLEAGP